MSTRPRPVKPASKTFIALVNSASRPPSSSRHVGSSPADLSSDGSHTRRKSPPGPNTQAGTCKSAWELLTTASVPVNNPPGSARPIFGAGLTPGRPRGSTPPRLFMFCTAILYPNLESTSTGNHDYFYRPRRDLRYRTIWPYLVVPAPDSPQSWALYRHASFHRARQFPRVCLTSSRCVP